MAKFKLYLRYNSETGELIPGQMKYATKPPGPEWQEISKVYCCRTIVTTTTTTIPPEGIFVPPFTNPFV